MTAGLTELIAAMDDEHGLTISVHRDHDGVRLEAGGAEIMLSQDGAAALARLLKDAEIEAALWEMSV